MRVKHNKHVTTVCLYFCIILILLVVVIRKVLFCYRQQTIYEVPALLVVASAINIAAVVVGCSQWMLVPRKQLNIDVKL